MQQKKVKNKLNNKGIIKKKTILFLIFIIAIVIFSYLTLVSKEKAKISNFKRLTEDFIYDTNTLISSGVLHGEEIFLYDVINLGHRNKLKSPFNENEFCDLYESKIRIQGTDEYVTLKCSEYIIYDHLATDEEFIIYKVSEWSEQKIEGDNVQTTTLYNYSYNGEVQFSDYYTEKEFLVKYSNNTGYSTNLSSSLKKEHTLLEKTYYRTIEEVK